MKLFKPKKKKLQLKDEQKFWLCGPSGSGTTCTAIQLVQGVFVEVCHFDCMQDSYRKTWLLPDIGGQQETIMIEFYETNVSHNEYASLNDLYLRNTDCMIWTFSVASNKNFEELVQMQKDLRSKCMFPARQIVLGTCLDMPREVSTETAEAWARSIYCSSYVEISNKTLQNFPRFREIITEVATDIALFKSPKQRPHITSCMKTDLLKVFNNKKASDFSFLVEGRPIYVSRLILLSRFPGVLEDIPANLTEFEKKGIKYTAAEEVLKWVYLGGAPLLASGVSWADFGLAVRSLRVWLLMPYVMARENQTPLPTDVDRIPSFALIFDSEVMTDLVITAEGKTLKVHKVILLARSEYFSMMLEDCGDSKDPIPFPEPYPIVHEAIKFLYTDSLSDELALDNPATLQANFRFRKELLIFSHKYLILALKQQLVAGFLDCMNHDNALEIWDLAVASKLQEFVDCVEYFITHGSCQIAASKTFKTASAESIARLKVLDRIVNP